MKSWHRSQGEEELLQRFEAGRSRGKSVYFDIEEYEQIIDQYILREEFDMAEKALESARAIHRDSDTLRMKAARICLFRKRPEEALSLLGRQNDEEALILRAAAWLQQGRQEQAFRLFDDIIAGSDLEKEYTLLDIAEQLVYYHYYKEALEKLETAWSINPSLTDIYDLAVECCDRLHDEEGCIRFYQRELDVYPYDSSVWASLSELYFRRKDYEAGIDAMEFALASSRSYNPLWAEQLGQAYTEMNDFGQALKHYQAARQAYLEQYGQEDGNLLGEIAECYEKLGRFDEALDGYHRCLKVNPDDDDAYVGIGICLAAKQEYQQSLQAYEQALRLNPHNPDVWSCVGELFTLTENFDQAVEAYRLALDLNSEQPDIWFTLGNLLFTQDEFAQALQAYEQALRLDPEIENLHLFAALACRILGLDEQAEDYLAQAVLRDPEARKTYESILNES
ncbi:MAG: tetratricopeptide repeat protein [Bacteroidales bacterium]|nr:tetratricopeptide repeat protein [Bacteroidales bacterium]